MDQLIKRGSPEYEAVIQEAAAAGMKAALAMYPTLKWVRAEVISKAFGLERTAFNKLVNNPANKIRVSAHSKKVKMVNMDDLNAYFERKAL
jgi:hypothetical protein